jgi:hypothetical protein
MGWEFCGTDDDGREIGYGVAATCDFPGCAEKIDRGLAYVCGTMHGGENGCGKYFCDKHNGPSKHDCECLKSCAAGEHFWYEVPASRCYVCGVEVEDLEADSINL